MLNEISDKAYKEEGRVQVVIVLLDKFPIVLCSNLEIVFIEFDHTVYPNGRCIHRLLVLCLTIMQGEFVMHSKVGCETHRSTKISPKFAMTDGDKRMKGQRNVDEGLWTGEVMDRRRKGNER